MGNAENYMCKGGPFLTGTSSACLGLQVAPIIQQESLNLQYTEDPRFDHIWSLYTAARHCCGRETFLTLTGGKMHMTLSGWQGQDKTF